MKNFLLSGLVAVVLAMGGICVQAHGQSTPGQSTQPAKPPIVAAPPSAETKQVDVPKTESLPAPNQAMPVPEARASKGSGSGTARAPFVIGPEDVLMIRVWQEPNLSGQVTVGPDGMISLQLIDEVKADGLTPEQLKASLTERLKGFIVNPDVNVQVLRVNSRKFIIQGEVNRPGSFPLTGPTTVFEALVSAAGFHEFAKPNKIYILRTEIDPKTKKAETKKFKFNYKEVSHGKRMEQNILILNGDQIFVP